jgi:tetratricopeptide (TPR) repeat protein
VRDRLRQRFSAISSQRPPPPVSAPAPVPEQSRRTLIDGLRQSIRASAALSGTPQAQAESFLKKGREAEQSGDALLAASQLQAGLALDPNNQELLTEYDRVSKVVARNLAGNYEKQAQYEEKTGNWQAAARSWARVSDGRPEDANAARRSAEAMLKAGDDLHRAQKYAQKAASLDGRSLANLTVLARVYLAAGLKLNALRELEKAAQLAPNDEMVNNLLREAR